MSLLFRALSILFLASGLSAAGPPAFDRLGDPLPPGAVARLGTLRFRHASNIHALAFAPDGRTIVSGGDDKAVCVWEAATGRLVRKLADHSGAIRRAVFSPDGKLLAVNDDNGEVRVWAVGKGESLYHFQGHAGVLPAFSADGKWLAVCDQKHRAHLLEPATGKERKVVPLRNAPSALALSPEGSLLAAGDGSAVRLHDVATGKKLRTYEGYSSGRVVVFAPDGKTLASGGDSDHVAVWEVASEDPLCSFRISEETGVAALAYSADGTILHVVTQDGLVVRCDPRTGKELSRRGERDEYERCLLALSPDGRRLALAENGSVRIRDLATGRDEPALRQQVPIYHARWSPVPGKNGPVAALQTSDEKLVLWEPLSPDEPRRLAWAENTFVAAFSPDGKWVASQGGEHLVRLWNAADGTEGPTIKLASNRAYPLGFSPAGGVLAVEGDDTIHLLDPETGKERLTIRDAPIAHPCPGFTGDGRTLAALTRGGNVLQLWEVSTGRERGRVPLAAQPEAIALAPDGTTVATASSAGIDIYHLGRARLLRRLVGGEYRGSGVAYAPGGKLLATGGYDGTVRLWDLESGRELRRLEGHGGSVSAIAFSPDGKYLLSAGADATALVWDVAAVLAAAPAPVEPVPVRAVEALWTDLADADARKAFAAITDLAERPGVAVPFLKERLKPVPAPETGAVARLVADLDSDRFEKRERARQELQALDRLAGPALRQALAGQPTPDVRRHLEGLLAKLDAPPEPARLRELRAVEVLEKIDTPEARAVLEALATGARGARLSDEARSAVERLRHRAGLPR